MIIMCIFLFFAKCCLCFLLCILSSNLHSGYFVFCFEHYISRLFVFCFVNCFFILRILYFALSVPFWALCFERFMFCAVGVLFILRFVFYAVFCFCIMLCNHYCGCLKIWGTNIQVGISSLCSTGNNSLCQNIKHHNIFPGNINGEHWNCVFIYLPCSSPEACIQYRWGGGRGHQEVANACLPYTNSPWMIQAICAIQACTIKKIGVERKRPAVYLCRWGVTSSCESCLSSLNWAPSFKQKVWTFFSVLLQVFFVFIRAATKSIEPLSLGCEYESVTNVSISSTCESHTFATDVPT